MATDVIRRSVKGSALTHAEMDQNLESMSMTVDAQTTNYTVLVTDQNKLIEMNGASITLTLCTVATAAGADTDSFHIWVKNIHTSSLAVDGNGAETIDGAANITLLENEGVLLSLSGDGTEWTILATTNASLLGITSTATELNVLDGILPTTAELNYVNGVTSAIQTQLNARALSTDVDDLSGVTDAATARTNLGLGTIATQAANSVSITGGSVTGITDVTVADGGTGASTAANARTNLGLGTIATQASNSVSITGGAVTGITDITVADGGTGSSTAAGARTNLGLGALAVLADIDETNIDWANFSGVAQILEDFDLSVGANDAAWTQLGDSTNDILVYVPASASNLRYVMYWRRNGVSTNGQVRMYHSAHDGTTLTTTSTSLIISSPGTLDVADEAGGGVILSAEATTGGGSDTIVVDRIVMWFE